MNILMLNQLAEMAKSAARVVRLFGFDPKVAFLSHSTFGEPAYKIELKA